MASTDDLFTKWPRDNIPPAADAARRLRVGPADVLVFPDTGNPECRFKIWLPNRYGSGGLDLKICLGTDTAIANDARIGVSFMRFEGGSGDVEADSFAAEKTIDVTAPGSASNCVYATISFLNSEIDGLLKNEMGILRVRRVLLASQWAGDAYFHGIHATES